MQAKFNEILFLNDEINQKVQHISQIKQEPLDVIRNRNKEDEFSRTLDREGNTEGVLPGEISGISAFADSAAIEASRTMIQDELKNLTTIHEQYSTKNIPKKIRANINTRCQELNAELVSINNSKSLDSIEF